MGVDAEGEAGQERGSEEGAEAEEAEQAEVVARGEAGDAEPSEVDGDEGGGDDARDGEAGGEVSEAGAQGETYWPSQVAVSGSQRLQVPSKSR